MSDNSKLIGVSKAAKILGVSLDTLRRWDKSGKLVAMKTKGGQRRYSLEMLQAIMPHDLFSIAMKWASASIPDPLIPSVYCQTRAQFETRLHAMEIILSQQNGLEQTASLISSTTGEIGNNSFDHNLGNWIDVPGIFFGFDVTNRKIALADRGQGILKTLKRVRPDLTNDEEALRVAFTEVVTGRAPEKRGNGLKFVRRIVGMNVLRLTFQTGSAKFVLEKGTSEITIHKTTKTIRGCLAQLEF